MGRATDPRHAFAALWSAHGHRAATKRERRKDVSTSALDREIAGLDYVRRLITGEIASVPIADTLNFRVMEAEHGRVAVAGAPDHRSYNLIGTVHGGWTASILDTAMGLAVLSQLEPERTFTTVDLRVNYLRAVTQATGEVIAEGRVVHAGRRLAYCESSLKDRAGRMLAHATGSCMILARP